MQEGAKAAVGDEVPNLYFEMVQVFLNTIRMSAFFLTSYLMLIADWSDRLIKNAEDP